ncbi:hypothetical protein [Cupriavidus sp. UME77]|uniref:hypothetical protein n=1 Tax=Cupriavidus sp. UME77 TaxID=1862321 RepID=UPI001603D90C|nr:hypothetical protein [Cupriavidus sp. UME77]MBB1629629.1 hypothetical protein [Cupriavidus sp. UME77]
MTTITTPPTLYCVRVSDRLANGNENARLLAMQWEGEIMLTTYLSPLDAMLHSSRSGKVSSSTHTHVRLDQLDPGWLRLARADGFVCVEVICGFCAKDEHLIMGPHGGLQAYNIPDAVHAYPVGESVSIRTSLDAWREVDLIFENAGLFAWQETVASQSMWDAERYHRAVKEMCRSANDFRSDIDVRDMNQIAVFDPEAGAWHFVPGVSREAVSGETAE